jgi:hypothetical protein
MIIADIQALLVRTPRFATTLPAFSFRSLHHQNFECIPKIKNLPKFSTGLARNPTFVLTLLATGR